MKTTILKSMMMVLMALSSLNAYAYDAYIDGIYYNLVSKTKTAEVTCGDEKYIGNVKIPASVLYEGESYSVISIGRGAFYLCDGVASIDIAEGVTFIDDGGIYMCSGLSSITIPKSMMSIGWNPSFPFDGNIIRHGCFGFTSSDFTVNISDLGSWCNCFFASDTNPLRDGAHLRLNGEEVTDLIIPDGVTKIGDNAFRGCSRLKSVKIPNSVTSIGRSAFYGCSNLTTLTIPNSVTSIGDGAFYQCSSLTFVSIPNSVTEIGVAAFFGCTNLTSVDIPNSVTEIGMGAFSGCSGLVSVTIPNSVTSIGESIFANCSNITSIDIPNSVTSIGGSAFSGWYLNGYKQP